MIKTLYAVFDGKVLHPEEPVELKPSSRVRLTIESAEASRTKSCSFLQTARSLNLAGPADWSARFEEYLYGSKNRCL